MSSLASEASVTLNHHLGSTSGAHTLKSISTLCIGRVLDSSDRHHSGIKRGILDSEFPADVLAEDGLGVDLLYLSSATTLSGALLIS